MQAKVTTEREKLKFNGSERCDYTAEHSTNWNKQRKSSSLTLTCELICRRSIWSYVRGLSWILLQGHFFSQVIFVLVQCANLSVKLYICPRSICFFCHRSMCSCVIGQILGGLYKYIHTYTHPRAHAQTHTHAQTHRHTYTHSYIMSNRSFVKGPTAFLSQFRLGNWFVVGQNCIFVTCECLFCFLSLRKTVSCCGGYRPRYFWESFGIIGL